MAALLFTWYNFIVITSLSLQLQEAGIAFEIDGLIGSGPLPGKVTVPGHIDVSGKHLIWQWMNPDSSGVEFDFNTLLAMVILIPKDFDTSSWSYDFLEKERPHQADTAGMLDAFVRITNRNSALRFAKRFGVLHICRHGLQYSHSQTCLASSQQAGWNPASREPLGGWFHHAERARAILSLSASIQIADERDPIGSRDDWAFLYERKGGKASIDELMQAFTSTPSLAKSFLVSDINDWLVEGNVRPTISWGEEASPGFSLNASTFGLLGVQLMTAVSKVQDVYFCDGCGNPYSRKKRKPQAGRNQYCDACGEQVASKNRQARYRQKVKTNGIGEKS
jgi:DNA-directed RNA polymerase subunit RPC12/RpoP